MNGSTPSYSHRTALLRSSYQKQGTLIQEALTINQRLLQYSCVLRTLQTHRTVDKEEKAELFEQYTQKDEELRLQEEQYRSLLEKFNHQRDQVKELQEQLHSLNRTNEEQDKRIKELLASPSSPPPPVSSFSSTANRSLSPSFPSSPDHRPSTRHGSIGTKVSRSTVQRYMERTKLPIDDDNPSPFQEWIKDHYPNTLVHRSGSCSSSSFPSSVPEDKHDRSLPPMSNVAVTRSESSTHDIPSTRSPPSSFSVSSHPFAKGAEEYRQQRCTTNPYHFITSSSSKPSPSPNDVLLFDRTSDHRSYTSLTQIINETRSNLSSSVKDPYRIYYRTMDKLEKHIPKGTTY